MSWEEKGAQVDLAGIKGPQDPLFILPEALVILLAHHKEALVIVGGNALGRGLNGHPQYQT